MSWQDRLKATPDEQGYTPRGQFGPAEMGSVVANTPLAVAATSSAVALDNLSHQWMPQGGAAGGLAAFACSTLLWIILKVIASIIRNHGESFLRKFGKTLYSKSVGLDKSKCLQLCTPTTEPSNATNPTPPIVHGGLPSSSSPDGQRATEGSQFHI